MTSSHQPQSSSRAGSLSLVGGEVAFDFTNTCSGRGGANRVEHLLMPQHLLTWAVHAGVIAHDSGRGALEDEALSAALELRETIYATAEALAQGAQPGEEVVEKFSDQHKVLLARARLARAEKHFHWSWPQEDLAGRILGPVALSFASVLAMGRLERIRQCPGTDCGWLFYDTSKNGRRRWCEMQVCGNRNKLRAYRERMKSGV